MFFFLLSSFPGPVLVHRLVATDLSKIKEFILSKYIAGIYLLTSEI